MVKVKEDLTGKVFGKLTVIKQVEDYIEPNGRHRSRWLCKCECGNEKKVTVTDLKKGDTKSCGCLRLNLNNFVKVKEDLTGKVFGRLTVIKQVEDYIASNGRHHQRWLCKCECGNEKEVLGNSLKRGFTQSCGCLLKTHINKCNNERKKYNKYILNLQDEFGLYGIGYCSNIDEKFFFDMEDYDKIKNYCWRKDFSTGYMKYTTSNNKSIYMHRLIIDNKYKIVNHIDRDGLNNRKYNLREATFQQNSQNISLSKRNTSGFIGVRKIKRIKECDCWEGKIKINRKTKYLGRFTDKEDAIRARLQAEKEYFGEFAPQRHLFKEYGIEDDFSKEK